MNVSRNVTLLDEFGLLSWEVLLYGWKKGWVTPFDINFLSDKMLSSGAEGSAVACLTSSQHLSSEVVSELLEEVVDACSGTDSEHTLSEKWRLVKLVDLIESSKDWETTVTQLESLSAEFGFPDDMSLCSKYRPSSWAIEEGFARREDLSVDPIDAARMVIQQLRGKFGM